MCLREVSTLRHFCLFFKLCLVVFNSPVAIPAHGLLGLSPIHGLRFILENANLLALYICATTHFTTLLTRALFYGSFHCSYIFVPCLAFRQRRIFIFGAIGYFKLGALLKGLRCLMSYKNSTSRARYIH